MKGLRHPANPAPCPCPGLRPRLPHLLPCRMQKTHLPPLVSNRRGHPPHVPPPLPRFPQSISASGLPGLPSPRNYHPQAIPTLTRRSCSPLPRCRQSLRLTARTLVAFATRSAAAASPFVGASLSKKSLAPPQVGRPTSAACIPHHGPTHLWQQVSPPCFLQAPPSLGCLALFLSRPCPPRCGKVRGAVR